MTKGIKVKCIGSNNSWRQNGGPVVGCTYTIIFVRKDKAAVMIASLYSNTIVSAENLSKYFEVV